VLVARGVDGDCRCCPAVEMIFRPRGHCRGDCSGRPSGRGPHRGSAPRRGRVRRGNVSHEYGKAATRPFRKMGHVTVLDRDIEVARQKAERVRELMEITGEDRP
jgi:hypothetical protein